MRGDFERWQLIGYATVAILAIVPTIGLVVAGIAIGRGSYPFVVFSLVILLAAALLRPLQLVARRHPSPTRQLVADAKANWPWLATALFLAVALPQTLAASSTLKKHIPDFVPYYADPALIRLDAIFGIDPWRITHALIGITGTRVIDALYGIWHVWQIALIVWMVLSRDRRFQLQAVLSFQAAWLFMGGFLAIALASVGPCFVDDFFGNDHYAPLMAQLPDTLYSQAAMDYLLAGRRGDVLAGGISAMPSLHVAIAVLIGICLRDRWPRWQWPAWIYAAVIFIGSIHLGWHYASDGVVAAVGMITIWKAAGWYVDLLQRRPRPLASEVA
jgi:hypothetical protein